MKKITHILLVLCIFITLLPARDKRIRDYGIQPGMYPPGPGNAITDVNGVLVGQVTIIKGSGIRTGVTAILPHSGNIFRNKVPAAIFVANGFGKLTGISQVEELGYIETPIVLTNTLSVPTAAAALITYTLSNPENREVMSVNPIAGETNDGYLNDIRGRHVREEDVLSAIRQAGPGAVEEGSVGAGTGTTCFGFKGGIGTASRRLPPEKGGFTVGVLVQTNFGGDLTIAGIPVARELELISGPNSGDGSCMIVIATDAPLLSRNLKRLARRATLGLARSGGNCSNGSGEYVIAFSTDERLRERYQSGKSNRSGASRLRNDRMTPLFEAVAEATEEAILNSLFTAETVTGYKGHTAQALPVDRILPILKKHKVLYE